MRVRRATRTTTAVIGVLATLAAMGPANAGTVTPDDPVPAPQQIAPQVTIVARADAGNPRVVGPRGTRVWTASAMADHGVPAAAMRAYRHAAATLAHDDPSCQIPWTLLAAIGKVESDHGRYGGSVLGADGVPHPGIIGLRLDGAGPVAAVHDTDHGRLDHDMQWDRAVGPMQFLPGTWAHDGRDGDGDGTANPQDIDDAALTAATYLCAGSGSVLSGPGMKAAIFRYNPSDYYVALVMAFETGYRTGVFVLPPPPAPEPAPATTARRHKRGHHHRAATTVRTPAPSPTAAPHHHTSSPSPSPTAPKPSPTPKPPKPSPSPTGPAPLELVGLTGTLASCPAGWCLDGTALDLGPDAQLAATAAADYDGDGSTETVADELAGLAGTSVSVQVAKGGTVVYSVAGKPYRNADGTFPH